jgi:hypothetical protein
VTGIADDAARMLEGIAEGAGFLDVYQSDVGRHFAFGDTEAAGGFCGELVARLRSAAQGGSVGLCDHLAARPWRPAWWTPYHPARIRCRDCYIADEKTIAGTEEDRRCDRCGKVERPGFIHGLAVQLPASVREGVARGPLTITFGLCDEDSEREPRLPGRRLEPGRTSRPGRP